MKVYFHTNIDVHNEKWPTELPYRPMVGDLVRSSTKWRDGYQLELVIVRITLTEDEIDAELSLVTSRFACISDFNKFYEKVTR